MTKDLPLNEYAAKFGVPPPMPFGVDSEFYARVLAEAIRTDTPIPDDFDWYPGVPEDAKV